MVEGLKPRVNNSSAVQEPKTSTDTHTLPSPNIYAGENPLSFYFRRSFSAGNLRNEAVSEEKLPVASHKKSSPTAPSLLLGSSVFRELVAKNYTVTEEESSTESGRNPSQEVNGEYLAGRFDNGICNVPFVLSSDGYDDIELQEQFNFNFECLENLQAIPKD